MEIIKYLEGEKQMYKELLKYVKTFDTPQFTREQEYEVQQIQQEMEDRNPIMKKLRKKYDKKTQKECRKLINQTKDRLKHIKEMIEENKK